MTVDDKALVFISCGQYTDEEKKLGGQVLAVVNGIPGVEGYFAEDQASAKGVAEHIFGALDRASAFIAIMHHRGEVTTTSGTRIRGSVWVEQEIAIVGFLEATGRGPLPLAVYVQKGIHREGVRDKILANPVTFENSDEIIDDLRKKLRTWNLKPRRSAEPRVHISIGWEKDSRSTGEVHIYHTKITMRNDGAKAIRNYVAELRFPRQYVMPHVLFQSEDRDHPRRDPYRLFREEESNGTPLLPGDSRQILKIDYQMNDVLHGQLHSHPELGDVPALVRVFVDDQPAGEASRPLNELQFF